MREELYLGRDCPRVGRALVHVRIAYSVERKARRTRCTRPRRRLRISPSSATSPQRVTALFDAVNAFGDSRKRRADVLRPAAVAAIGVRPRRVRSA